MSAEPSREAPLRVLHVYSGNLYGGIETFLRTLAQERAKCPEMEPEFALCFEGRLADEIRASGAPLHMLGGVRLSRPWTALRARMKLRAVLRARKPDVVICHAVWPYVVFGAVVKASKARLVFYQHDIGKERAPLNFIARAIRPDVVIANSKYTAAHAYPKWEGIDAKVVYPAVRVPQKRLTAEERRALRTELGANDDDVVILQASRMQRWKGQALLVEALALLPKDAKWKCWFAGGAQRAEEKAFVAELKASVTKHAIADRVRFLGQRDDVSALMDAADVFCQPNLKPEPFGIAFVEALEAGLRAITTEAAGGALEIGPSRTARDTPLSLCDALTQEISDEAIHEKRAMSAHRNPAEGLRALAAEIDRHTATAADSLA